MAQENSPVMESIPTEFDYFEPSVIQAAIISEYDEPFGPIGAMQDDAPIEIAIPASSGSYRDLNNSRLELKCKITKGDSTAIAAGTVIGPINLVLHSAFQNIEVDISGKRISDANNFYGYRAFLETLLSYSADVLKTRAYTEGWAKDTEGKFDALDKIGDDATNNGHKARCARFAESACVTLIGRPHLDLFHQEKDMPPGVRITLRFIPAPVDFVLKRATANTDAFRLKIVSMKLWVRTKEVSPSLLLAHQTMLQRRNIRIPYTKIAIKHLTIPTGLSSIEFENLYTGVQPTRMLIAFIANNHLMPNKSTNPFKFENLDIRYLALRINGEQFPRTPLQPDFGASKDYIREYMALLDALGIDTGNKAIDLTPSEWGSSYPFYMFRTNPSGLPSIPRTGASRLEIQFRTATAAIYNILCYAEFPAVLEIDQFNNVLA